MSPTTRTTRTFLAWLGFGLYVVSFFMPAVSHAGSNFPEGVLTGWRTALIASLIWYRIVDISLGEFSKGIQFFATGLVNPLIIMVFGFFVSGKGPRIIPWLRISALCLLPFPWFLIHRQQMTVDVGYYCWMVGMLIVLLSVYAETPISREATQSKRSPIRPFTITLAVAFVLLATLRTHHRYAQSMALASGGRGHTATRLKDGRVLLAGGFGFVQTANQAASEAYNPTTGLWTKAKIMGFHREGHTATLLNNGKVLVVGGSGVVGRQYIPNLNTAGLYDPVTDSWQPTGSLTVGRRWHTANLLANGKVLVAGGMHGSDPLSSAEIYDPSEGTWRPAAPMAVGRFLHTATLLLNGKVMVAGGTKELYGTESFASVELFDPTNGTWSAASPLLTGRAAHSAVLLTDGRVLVTGGVGPYTADLLSSEIYSPATNTWSTFVSMPGPRYNHSALLLPSGEVMIIGGEIAGATTVSATVGFRLAVPNNIWTMTSPMPDPLHGSSATVLANGKVLLVGADFPDKPAAEIYDPSTDSWTPVARKRVASRLLFF